MFSIKKILLNITLFSSIFPIYSSQAGTTTANLTVTATSIATCVVSPSTMPFGNYTSTQINQNSTISVTCTPGTGYSIALNAGLNSSGGMPNRRMLFSTGNYMPYQLYNDSGRTQIWGDSTAGTTTISSTGTGIAQSFTVYGQIAAGLFVAPGSYTDTVTITVSY